MATSYNISIYQGDLFQATLSVKDANNIPINLTNYDVRGQVRASYGSTGILLDLEPVVTNEASGLISITIPSTVSREMPIGMFLYDIERYPSGLTTGNSTKLMRGKFIILPEVTR